MSVWTEHRNPEGRTYWFNTTSKESVWEKPDELKSPFERALKQTPWKEYFSGGKKYYYNTTTKESKWDMPEELLLLMEKVETETKDALAPPPSAALQAILPAGAGVPQSSALIPLGADSLPEQPIAQPAASLHPSALPARPNPPDEPTIPHNGFATFEEGEKAFVYLLRKAGVDATWTWDQTMRAIITDPLYKALNSLAEKKATWQKYTEGLKAKEQEEREARLAKIRPAVRNMLKGNPNVFHYTTFSTADKLFAQHPIWQQARVESERKLIFDEYVAELKQREVQENRAARNRSITKLMSLFKQLGVDVLTRWRSAHSLVLESEEWQSDEELRQLPGLDILLAFEDYSRVREREFEDEMRRKQVNKSRSERKAREAFKALLQEFVASGGIGARSKWKHVYPKFSTDNRYLDMLGRPGSNPIELFWDVVDNLDQKLDAKIATVGAAIKRHNTKLSSNDEGSSQQWSIQPETTEADFLKVVQENGDEELAALSPDDLKQIFTTLHEQTVRQQADEKRRTERRARHMQDDLRYAIKKLPEPLDISLGYVEAVPFIEHLPEFKVLDDEGRRVAFSKFVKRQKERLREISDDGGSTASRKRKEPSHREAEKERDRDLRERDRDKDKERDRDRDRDRDRERDREKDKDRDHDRDRERDRDRDRDRERERDRDRDRDRERDRDRDKDRERGSRYHRGHEDRSSRDYVRDRERDREGDSPRDRRDRDRFAARVPSSRRDDRKRRAGKEEEDRGSHDEPREKREAENEERSEKRVKYDTEAPSTTKDRSRRAETPEEGEI